METFFKKYLGLVLLALLSLSALLFAAGTNRLLASAIVPPPVPLVLEKASEQKVERADRGDAILARNVFDSTATLAAPDPVQEQVEPVEASLAPGDELVLDDSVPVSELGVVVTGTVVSSIPSSSNASIQDGSETSLYFEGDEVKDGAMIIAIRRGAVYVLNSGRVERLVLADEEAARKGRSSASSRYKRPTTSRSTHGKSKGKDAMASIREGIKKVGADEYEVDRAMLDEQLQDLNKLGSQARIIPHYKDGRSDGFKLVGIRPGSLYSYIGIRSGDVIRRVNGEDLSSPSKALALYEKLRSASNITVDIERRGSPMSLNYSIK